MTRYARQTVLSHIGPQGQKILSDAKVLCVGVGGLGSPATLYLASAGVGTLGLIDADHVSISNLQRQILFATTEEGLPKVQVAAQKLKALNPEVSIEVHNYTLNAQNVLSLFERYDVIVDGTDNFSTKFLINDAAVKLGKPVVYGSILQFEGQVSVFDSTGGPCYRCLHPQPPQHSVPNCAEAGVLGALAGIIGSMQALEAIKLILRAHSPTLRPLIGRLLIVNGTDMSCDSLKIRKNPQCPVCSQSSQDIHLKDETMVCTREQEVTGSELQEKLENKNLMIIDIREDEEWAEGHIPHAIHWSLSRITAGQLPPLANTQDKEVILYCHGGVRSAYALDLLQKRGLAHLKHLRGGLISWSGPLTRTP